MPPLVFVARALRTSKPCPGSKARALLLFSHSKNGRRLEGSRSDMPNTRENGGEPRQVCAQNAEWILTCSHTLILVGDKLGLEASKIQI